jgi:hypothetical protein
LFSFRFSFFLPPFCTCFPFLVFSYLFIYHFLLYFLFLFLFLYSFLFNIFPVLIFLLFELRCKFILAILISCFGHKYLVGL